jgi:TRAP-type C4-dicarboxylate transport system permease small subunit
MKIVRILDKIVEILSKLALLCGGLLLLAMAINVTYGVLARYAFNSPSVYAMELTKILMIPALVLAVSYVQRHDKHLQVDFLSSHFPTKVRLILHEILVPLMGLFVIYVMVWKGWESATYSYSIHETSYSSWAEVLWPVRATVPVGYGLLFLVMVAQLCKAVAALVVASKKTTEVVEVPTEGLEVTAESERV